jgi:hypothetical protein
MIKIYLESNYINRLKDYYASYLSGKFRLDSDAKSDYWKLHSKTTNFIFHHDSVTLSGNIGFHFPLEVSKINSLRNFSVRAVRNSYKSAILWLDPFLHLSSPTSLGIFLTPDMAYDRVMQRHPCIDYVENPFNFNPLKLSTIFKNYKAIVQNWFLKDRYLVNNNIIYAAYRHSMFSHFLTKDAKTYLEIGAGTGHLASLFHYYNKMRITIIDLPEIILYSMIYLKDIFPASRILLPHEITEITKETLMDYDIIFLLPTQTGLLPEDGFDLAVNVASMMEMNHSQIEKYINLIQKVCKKGALFCNDNRIEKASNKYTKPIRAFEYPYFNQNEVIVNEINRMIRLIQSDDFILRIERIQK